MKSIFHSLPQKTVSVDRTNTQGAFEWWRHTIGHGGINSLPLPERVVTGSKKLQPRLVRTFIQQYFDIYPDHGKFDWSKLDPYMESLADTGGKVVAAITIKPKVLFPEIDEAVIMPNNIEEWQTVIYELVKRYSVDRQIVTYWEIGNEPDIGENGGSPYLCVTPEQYNEFYEMTIKPVIAAFPAAKVGGPALASAGSKLMLGLIEHCSANDMQLDFVSWHLYHNDPQKHAQWVDTIKAYLADHFPTKQPEMLITEWSKGFDSVSIEELAFEPERAAVVATGIMAMMDAGLDWSFYYHVWDQVNYLDEFEPFFHDVSIMTKHWNEVPHRFGLFGVEGEVRPQYFVYQMFSRMGEEQIATTSDDSDLWVRGATAAGQVSVMIANYNTHSSRDVISNLEFTNMAPGRKMLKVYRIDDKRNWSSEELELIPVEQREVDMPEKFMCQVYCPGDSVTLLTLVDL